MIPSFTDASKYNYCKPRASGDDPDQGMPKKLAAP